MKWFTAGLAIAAVVVLAVLLSHGWFKWPDFLHNLLAGLIVAIVTVSLVSWIVKGETISGQRRVAEPVLVGPITDTYSNVLGEARWLLDPGPPGIEASAPWSGIADAFQVRREQLGQILTADMLLQVVQLEAELRKVDFLTARSNETRKVYRDALLRIWPMLSSLSDMVIVNKRTRKRYTSKPPDLTALRALSYEERATQ